MKKYWMWKIHFENYGMIICGYFDDFGNGTGRKIDPNSGRHYLNIFQIPWEHVHKDKLEDDYVEISDKTI